MKIKELDILAEKGAFLMVSAADLRELVQELTLDKKAPQKQIKPLSMRQAGEFYNRDRKTITKYIKDGNLKAIKRGARWEIYPSAE